MLIGLVALPFHIVAQLLLGVPFVVKDGDSKKMFIGLTPSSPTRKQNSQTLNPPVAVSGSVETTPRDQAFGAASCSVPLIPNSAERGFAIVDLPWF